MKRHELREQIDRHWRLHDLALINGQVIKARMHAILARNHERKYAA